MSVFPDGGPLGGARDAAKEPVPLIPRALEPIDLSKPLPRQEVLDIARLLVQEQGALGDAVAEEQKSKLEQLKTVLEM